MPEQRSTPLTVCSVKPLKYVRCLSSLSGLIGARSPSARAYIVENEMVVTQLCDRSAQFHSPLICLRPAVHGI